MPVCSSPLWGKALCAINYFDIYPFDGGGYLSQQQMVGSLDDYEIVHRIISEDALQSWGTLPKLDFCRLERWRTVEQSCWMNRMYFIASMARVSWLEKNTKMADVMKKIILHFLRNYPPPQNSNIIAHVREVERRRNEDYNNRSQDENARDETNIQYIWYDFQPAARLLHMAFGLWVLQELDAAKEEEYVEILCDIKAHAEFLKTVASVEPLKESDNHQSVRGVALLWAARIFRDTQEGKQYLHHGLNVCRFHAENDFAEDGSLKEISPSYHCFELWHIRDAVSIARELGTSLGVLAESRFSRAVSYVKALCQPNGCLPVINDGYAISVKSFLETLSMDTTNRKQTRTYWFSDAGLAVHNDSERYILLDASPFTGKASHYHAGKNALTYWYAGQPIFIDSGCCSYDDILLTSWYKTSNAHSSLLINGHGDGDLIGTYNWANYPTLECDGWQDGSQAKLTSHLKSNSSEWAGVTWLRSLNISNNDSLSITDTIQLSRKTNLILCFNLHPDVELNIHDHVAFLKNGPVCLKMEVNAYKVDNIVLEQNVGRCYINGRHAANSQLYIRLSGQNKISVHIDICKK